MKFIFDKVIDARTKEYYGCILGDTDDKKYMEFASEQYDNLKLDSKSYNERRFNSKFAALRHNSEYNFTCIKMQFEIPTDAVFSSYEGLSVYFSVIYYYPFLTCVEDGKARAKILVSTDFSYRKDLNEDRFLINSNSLEYDIPVCCHKILNPYDDGVYEYIGSDFFKSFIDTVMTTLALQRGIFLNSDWIDKLDFRGCAVDKETNNITINILDRRNL